MVQMTKAEQTALMRTIMVRLLLSASAFFSLILTEGNAFSQEDPLGVFKKVEARFEPAEAKPGQAVTLKIELKLGAGWLTFPTHQPDPAARLYVNKIVLPKDGIVNFTGKIKEPEKPIISDEELIGMKEIHRYEGGGIWECEAVVSAKAAPGNQNVKIRFAPLVHSKDSCGPKRKFDLEATIKIVEK